MRGQNEPDGSMGIGKKIVAPVTSQPVRKHIHGHIYEVDGKLSNEQPDPPGQEPSHPKTPAEEFFDLFVKNVGGLC